MMFTYRREQQKEKENIAVYLVLLMLKHLGFRDPAISTAFMLICNDWLWCNS